MQERCEDLVEHGGEETKRRRDGERRNVFLYVGCLHAVVFVRPSGAGLVQDG